MFMDPYSCRVTRQRLLNLYEGHHTFAGLHRRVDKLVFDHIDQ